MFRVYVGMYIGTPQSLNSFTFIYMSGGHWVHNNQKKNKIKNLPSFQLQFFNEANKDGRIDAVDLFIF